MLGKLLRSAPVEERSTISLSQYGAWLGQISTAYSPKPVTIQSAMSIGAVKRCVNALATSVSNTPIDVVRSAGETRLPLSRQPQIVRSPSVVLKRRKWTHFVLRSALTDGNAFGIVTGTDGLARPTGIELIDPSQVSQRRLVKGVKTAYVADVGDMKVFPHGDLWHLPGKDVGADGFALSPIMEAAPTIGVLLAIREHAGRYFGDGIHPSMLVTSDQVLTPQQAKDIKQAVVNAGHGTREPLVFGAGLKVEGVASPTNEASELTALMQVLLADLCRSWDVPPGFAYVAITGQNITYANLAQDDVNYLKHSVESYFLDIEDELSDFLPIGTSAVFNRKAFLRSDASTRGDYLDKRLRNKTISVNEYRSLEDEPPVDDPEFDKPGIPGGPNDAPLDPSAVAAGGS